MSRAGIYSTPSSLTGVPALQQEGEKGTWTGLGSDFQLRVLSHAQA